jgi:hypothetical protein
LGDMLVGFAVALCSWKPFAITSKVSSREFHPMSHNNVTIRKLICYTN